MFEQYEDKKSLLTAMATTASSTGLHIKTIISQLSSKQMNKFNVVEDDFILKLYEDPRSVIICCADIWLSRMDLTEEEIQEIDNRRTYQQSILLKTVKVWHRTKMDNHLTKLLENKYFKTWEQLECWLNLNYNQTLKTL